MAKVTTDEETQKGLLEPYIRIYVNLNHIIMKPCDVKHYVMKPNTPVYDWPYEYSTERGRKKHCDCSDEFVYIANRMDVLNDVITQMQKSLSGAALTGDITEQITSIVTTKVSESLADIISRLTTIESKLNKLPSDSVLSQLSTISTTLEQFKTLQQEFDNLKTTVENHIKDGSESGSGDSSWDESRVKALEDTVKALQETTAALSATAIKEAVINDISDNIDEAVQKAIGNKLDELIAEKLKDTTLDQAIKKAQDNIKNLQTSLDTHINNTNIHVTADEKAKWDAAADGIGSSSGSDWDISMSNNTLVITKK